MRRINKSGVDRVTLKPEPSVNDQHSALTGLWSDNHNTRKWLLWASTDPAFFFRRINTMEAKLVVSVTECF